MKKRSDQEASLSTPVVACAVVLLWIALTGVFGSPNVPLDCDLGVPDARVPHLSTTCFWNRATTLGICLALGLGPALIAAAVMWCRRHGWTAALCVGASFLLVIMFYGGAIVYLAEGYLVGFLYE